MLPCAQSKRRQERARSVQLFEAAADCCATLRGSWDSLWNGIEPSMDLYALLSRTQLSIA